MNAYRIDFGETECMSFLMKDEEFVGKYKEILEKVSDIIKKLNNELIYNKKYLKAETKLITKTSTQKNALNVFIYHDID